jgi:ABC-type nitrate/sulfonate/bicarbonate transport system ATPase subunit
LNGARASGGQPVSLQRIGHTYGGAVPVEAIAGLDAEIAAGAFTAVVGPSGCGKSTLLRIVAGLTVPTRGTAMVGGVRANGRPGLVAHQPQGDVLMPWRRALANATIGAEVAGVPRADARRAAAARFERFALAGFERAWPAALSGGMRQRLALLRTFLVPRPVLLLDEPLGALDAITRRLMQEWLQEVWLEDGRTVVLVTHDVEEALLLADRVLVMSARPGRFVVDLPIAFERPRRPALVTEHEFVVAKRRLLDALSA